MKLLLELDLSAIVAEEPDDIGAAEGLAASMLHRAAGKIVKDGFPAVDGLAFALTHDGRRMGRMVQVNDKASPLFDGEEDASADLRLQSCERVLANIANSLRQAVNEEYSGSDGLSELIRNAYRACEMWSDDPDELARLDGLHI